MRYAERGPRAIIYTRSQSQTMNIQRGTGELANVWIHNVNERAQTSGRYSEKEVERKPVRQSRIGRVPLTNSFHAVRRNTKPRMENNVRQNSSSNRALETRGTTYPNCSTFQLLSCTPRASGSVTFNMRV